VRVLTITGDVTSEVWKAVAWIIGITVVCVPIAVARYRKVT